MVVIYCQFQQFGRMNHKYFKSIAVFEVQAKAPQKGHNEIKISLGYKGPREGNVFHSIPASRKSHMKSESRIGERSRKIYRWGCGTGLLFWLKAGYFDAIIAEKQAEVIEEEVVFCGEVECYPAFENWVVMSGASAAEKNVIGCREHRFGSNLSESKSSDAAARDAESEPRALPR